MNAATYCFELINCGNVQACKYQPRGDEANALGLFLGKPLGHEIFLTKPQVDTLRGLMGDKAIITHGVDDNKFGAFIKIIWSEKTNKNYYLLVFGGFVATVEPEPIPEGACDKANGFAALLIAGAIEKGRASKDSYATAGQDDYLITWLSKAQADALTGQLPRGIVKPDGTFATQVAGSFCYWAKKRTQTGAMLLCWMGEPSTPAAPVPVTSVVPVSGIPMDMDIPF